MKDKWVIRQSWPGQVTTAVNVLHKYVCSWFYMVSCWYNYELVWAHCCHCKSIFFFSVLYFFVLIIRSLCSVIIYTDEDTLKNANVKCLFVFVYTLQVSGFQSFLNTTIFNVCSLNNYVLFYMKGSK